MLFKTFLFLIVSLFVTEQVLAHSGRTDSSGCHRNSSTGGYHCHNSNYTPPTIPTPPTNLSVSCVNNQDIILKWNYVSSSSFYKVYYSNSCNSEYNYLDDTYSNNYTTNGLNGCNACLKIKACKSDYCSDYSREIKSRNIVSQNNLFNSIETINGNRLKFDNIIYNLYGITTPIVNEEMCNIEESLFLESSNSSKLFLDTLLEEYKSELKINILEDNESNIIKIDLSDEVSLSEFMVFRGYAVVKESDINNQSILKEYQASQLYAKNNSYGLWNSHPSVMNCLSSIDVDRDTKEMTLEEKITGLYIAFFERAPDYNGLNSWKEEGNRAKAIGKDDSSILKIISKGFATHFIFESKYLHLNNKDFVEKIYKNILGQAGDNNGVDYWTSQINEGLSRSDMVSYFIEVSLAFNINNNSQNFSNEELIKGEERQKFLYNKVTVALYFTNELKKFTNIKDRDVENDSAYKASIKIISIVTKDESTIKIATKFIDKIKNMNEPIKEFDLFLHE